MVGIIGRTHSLRLLGTSLPLTPNAALQIGYADVLTEKQSENAFQYACEYLNPFIKDQLYPEAVSCIKQAIVAADTLPLADAQKVEQQMFGIRWAGSDNKDALKSK